MLAKTFLHDISSPVQAAKIVVGILRKKLKGLDPVTAKPLLEYVERINGSIEDLSKLIHEERERLQSTSLKGVNDDH